MSYKKNIILCYERFLDFADSSSDKVLLPGSHHFSWAASSAVTYLPDQSIIAQA